MIQTAYNMSSFSVIFFYCACHAGIQDSGAANLFTCFDMFRVKTCSMHAEEIICILWQRREIERHALHSVHNGNLLHTYYSLTAKAN